MTVMRPPIPLITAADLLRETAGRRLVHQALDYWAERNPDGLAVINATRDTSLTWRQLRDASLAAAQNLRRIGFRQGDFLAASLPFLSEHIILEYACFRAGVIHAPLDLRLGPAEVLREVRAIGARGYAFLGKTPLADFRELATAVKAHCPAVEFLLQFSPPPECLDGAVPAAKLFETPATFLPPVAIGEDDGAQVIFTTGSTGSPKPALLSHRNITVQNMCICGAFFGGDSGARSLVNLPPSHVGGQTELMMSTFFGGGTAVLLEVFDAGRSMRAIARHRVEILGQIPAMFNLEWMLKDYDRHDLSSLKFAAYGGHAVSRPFVDQLAAMAPVIGTGLGLTEAAGFCTYVQAEADGREAILGGLGVDMPIYPCTIRQPMRADGNAGEELAPGEMGHVCFRGPQTFLGYVNDPEATAKAISRDGFLYTGDLGYKDAAGLHLTGREKWVIKSFGYQIFPGDVERHICTLAEKVGNCVVVGVAHEVVSEAVVAVVEKRPGVEVSRQELDRHARSLPSYMRPRHWILLEAGQMPLNRVAKPDYLLAQEMARQEIASLRARGEWDSGYGKGDAKESH